MGKGRKKRLKRWRKRVLQMIDDAEADGALTAREALEYRIRARSVNLLLILQLISLIAGIIREWWEKRNA